MSDTLVLDPSYRAIGLVSWQRAITLLFENKIEVIESYEDRTVCSVSITFKVPSVVRFLRAIRRRKQAVKFSREMVYARDHGTCQYCGRHAARDSFTYDHVIPRVQGGQTVWENVVVACAGCNQRKGGRTPEQAGMKLISQPTRPTKLPDTMHFTLTWRQGMPPSWRDFIASIHYWNDELK